ncbi:hypothetical protein [Natronolimnobius baerhuensis]|uniref:Uncharacterized protein n=1 Tax=Natronolimnobius baerhuensis TaxID=253108 RepID=A0A202E3U9_9EURY|nr:hypothetical protein [Natronolimnobius baerhuensis]OVE82901.1 hypothetical protein B2G88_18025 [Natronolimnobius baerhuensis]
MDCPSCGGSVTLETGPDRPLSTSVASAILAADEDEQIVITQNCWNCGWCEERYIRVESLETAEGDDVAIKRAALIDEITDELTAIDSLATLEDARAEIRRQRRLEPSSKESTDKTRNK